MTYSHGETCKANQAKELLFISRNNILWDRITIKAQKFVYTKESNKLSQSICHSQQFPCN